MTRRKRADTRNSSGLQSERHDRNIENLARRPLQSREPVLMTPRLVCLGEPMVEFVRQSGGAYRQGFGGDTSNAAIAAARQGASVGYLTALGQDRFGDALLDLWAREGVDTAHVRRSQAPTGIYFMDPDPEGRHYIYYRAGSAASRYAPDDLPRDIGGADILHLSGITLAVSDTLRATGFAAMDAVRAGGGSVSLDTNLRLKLWDIATARAVLEKAARLARIVITSEEDSEHLTGLTQPEEIAASYQGLGAEIVIVTLGSAGALIAENEHRYRIAPASAQPVDSTGAGDSFSGAFLAWWQETGDAREAGRRAAIVAAGTVSGLGAVDPIPRREDVLKALRAESGT